MPVGVELITFSLPCTLSVKADWCFLMTQNDWILSSSWADETFFSPQSVMWRKKLPTAAQTGLTFQPIACFCCFFCLFLVTPPACGSHCFDSLWFTAHFTFSPPLLVRHSPSVSTQDSSPGTSASYSDAEFIHQTIIKFAFMKCLKFGVMWSLKLINVLPIC